MLLDIKTAVLFGTFITFCLGVLLLMAQPGFSPVVRPALRLWMRVCFLQPLGFMVFAFRRDQDWVPGELTLFIGNVLMVAAFAYCARALHLLMRMPDPVRFVRIVMGLTIVFLAVIAIVPPWPGRFLLRIIVISLCILFLSLLAARPAIRGGRGFSRGASSFTALVFLFAAAALLWRIVSLLTGWATVDDRGLEPPLQRFVMLALGSTVPLIASYGFLVLCSDRLRQEMERRMATDYLTGAYVRSVTERAGGRALAQARRNKLPLAIAAIDIDHFKRINDSHGHAAGDAALQAVVTRLNSVLRAGDMLGRIGGEEFLVLLGNSDREQAWVAAERMRSAMADEPLAFDGQRQSVTLSVGVALLHDGDRNFSDLMRRADAALYAAKRGGRNRVEIADDPTFDPELVPDFEADAGPDTALPDSILPRE